MYFHYMSDSKEHVAASTHALDCRGHLGKSPYRRPRPLFLQRTPLRGVGFQAPFYLSAHDTHKGGRGPDTPEAPPLPPGTVGHRQSSALCGTWGGAHRGWGSASIPSRGLQGGTWRLGGRWGRGGSRAGPGPQARGGGRPQVQPEHAGHAGRRAPGAAGGREKGKGPSPEGFTDSEQRLTGWHGSQLALAAQGTPAGLARTRARGRLLPPGRASHPRAAGVSSCLPSGRPRRNAITTNTRDAGSGNNARAPRGARAGQERGPRRPSERRKQAGPAQTGLRGAAPQPCGAGARDRGR